MSKTTAFWMGVLVGFGVAFVLLLCGLMFFIWRHHMFIVGISNPAALVLLYFVPLMMLLTVAIAVIKKKKRNQTA